MLNLSQVRESEQIVPVFVDAINEGCPGVRLRPATKDDRPGATTLDIATLESSFGALVVEGDIDELPRDTLPLLRNAVGMLAIILENQVCASKLQQEREREARSAKQRHELMLQSSIDGFWVIDREGNLIEVNDAYCAMIGFSRDELLQSHVADLDINERREDVHRHIESIRNVGAHRFEARHRCKDGTTIDLEVSATFLEEDGGRVFTFFRDITARKEAERQRDRLEEQLRHTQKMEAVGQLAGSVAHDFNNILTAILGHVQLGMMAVERGIDHTDKVADALTEIDKNAQRAAALTKRLLGFSRRRAVKLCVMDLNSVIREMEDMLSRLIGEGIELRLELDPTLHAIRADVGQLDQLVMNLVLNARDAVSDDGIVVVRTKNIDVDSVFQTARPDVSLGPHVQLVVCDNGCGMDEPTRERIFEPFFTTKPKDKGTGLGLATVYGIAKRCDGRIDVQSEPGQGTTFDIIWPAAQQAAGIATPPRNASQTTKPCETILFCEDDPAVRDLTAATLHNAGYHVLTASSGPEGLQLARQHGQAIQLLLTDVIMPEMNGRELSDAMTLSHPDLPTLYLSGYPADVIAHHGVLDEQVNLLQKPFTHEQLLARVRETIDSHKPAPISR